MWPKALKLEMVARRFLASPPEKYRQLLLNVGTGFIYHFFVADVLFLNHLDSKHLVRFCGEEVEHTYLVVQMHVDLIDGILLHAEGEMAATMGVMRKSSLMVKPESIAGPDYSWRRQHWATAG